MLIEVFNIQNWIQKYINTKVCKSRSSFVFFIHFQICLLWIKRYLINRCINFNDVNVMKILQLSCKLDSIWTCQLHAIDFRIIGIGGINKKLGWRLWRCGLKAKVWFNVRPRVTFVLGLVDLKSMKDIS